MSPKVRGVSAQAKSGRRFGPRFWQAMAAVAVAAIVIAIVIASTGGHSGPSQVSYIHLSPQKGAPGETIHVIGTGFQPNEAVQLTFNKAPAGAATADGSGNFDATIVVPNLPNQGYLVSATGQSTGKKSADFTLRQ